jgi:hypothetical protein
MASRLRPLMLLVLVMSTTPAVGQGYYVRGLSRYGQDDVIARREGDPARASPPTYWEVRLFRNGVPRTGSRYWGLLIGPTAAHVMEQLRQQQENQVASDRYFGRQSAQVQETYFNALAVVDKDVVHSQLAITLLGRAASDAEMGPLSVVVPLKPT